MFIYMDIALVLGQIIPDGLIFQRFCKFSHVLQVVCINDYFVSVFIHSNAQLNKFDHAIK